MPLPFPGAAEVSSIKAPSEGLLVGVGRKRLASEGDAEHAYSSEEAHVPTRSGINLHVALHDSKLASANMCARQYFPEREPTAHERCMSRFIQIIQIGGSKFEMPDL